MMGQKAVAVAYSHSSVSYSGTFLTLSIDYHGDIHNVNTAGIELQSLPTPTPATKIAAKAGVQAFLVKISTF